MTLIGLIIALVFLGVVMWLINTLIPMDPKIKAVLNAVVLIVLILWLVNLFVPFNIPIRPITR